LVRLAHHLKEDIRRFQAELREADAKLEGMRTSTTQIRYLVLGGLIETSSLAVSLSSTMKLIKDYVDVVAANRVRLGTQ
jgi:hypothetical protein